MIFVFKILLLNIILNFFNKKTLLNYTIKPTTTVKNKYVLKD